jgi:macrolide-specific efflux system membrane fusion protein
MSFLRRLPLLLRRIPPLLRRLSLVLRRLSLQVPAPRRTSPPALVINAILVTLLLAGVLLSYRTIAVADTGVGTARTGLVTKGQVVSTVSASGTVQSSSTANVSFAAPGTVTDINVKVGDSVKKGQVLAKINASQAQEQLSGAQANLTSAQQTLSRVRASTSDATTIVLAQAQVTSAQNSVNAAQRAVNGATLTAPMDGTVIAVNGTVGNWSNGETGSGTATGGPSGNGGASGNGGTSNSTPFIQIVDLTKMQISASFPEADAIKLKTDQSVMVTWVALAKARVAGRLTAISPAATSQNNVNSYAVTVTLGWMPDGIRIGQTVTVAVTVAQVDDVVRAPATAVRDDGQLHLADVLRADGKRETRAVELGVQGDEFVEIRSGLNPGEQVALNLGGTRGRG